ncbi:MAG: methyl-accepting chemotaxis protein [Desulfobacteraceae bacterium]|nr:methyl-accepting chemotaxis protein [Desulfobacteraceae bacterium]MCB9495252.1 methyl-accepting chemotaxis protein [Desulfobacteraceae bacterium]
MSLENLSIGKKIAIIGIIPVLILFFSQSLNINEKLKEMNILKNMKDNIQMQSVSSQLIDHLQKERGRTAVFLNGGAEFHSVKKLRKETDSVFENWETARNNSKIEKNKVFHETANLQSKLNQIRSKYENQNPDLQPKQVEEYTEVINNLLDMQSEAANAKTAKGFGKKMTSLLVIEIAKENAGLLRANVSSILARNTAVSEEKFSYIITLNATTNTNLDSPALALSPEIKRELENNKKSHEWIETNKIFNQVLLKAGTGDFGISPDSFWKPVSKKIDDIGNIVQKSFDDMDLNIDTAIKQMKFEIIRAFIITALTLIITSSFIFFVIVSIIKNINNIKKSMNEIARGEGDLTKRLPVKGSDELAELAKTFNIFAENMRKMIAEIAESSQTLSDSTTQLSSIATQTANGADESSSSSQNVAMAAKEMNDSAISMSDSMERAANNLNSVASAMEEMSATISEIASNTSQANAQSEDASEKAKGFTEIMKELGLAAAQIGKVTETISDISEQTNLLALNATIEAARAGEAGKGFAVVANEIKELARQTSDATNNISTQISGIQKASQRAETDMETIVKSIYNVNEIVSAIAAAIEEQSSAVSEVSSNLSQSSEYVEDSNSQSQSMSSLSGEIADAINSVSSTVEQIKNGSHKTLETIEEQSVITKKITNQVGKFKV